MTKSRIAVVRALPSWSNEESTFQRNLSSKLWRLLANRSWHRCTQQKHQLHITVYCTMRWRCAVSHQSKWQGSFVTGILAEANAREMMLMTCDSTGWVRFIYTSVEAPCIHCDPHQQVHAAQRPRPSRKATATQTASSSRRRPHEAIGSADYYYYYYYVTDMSWVGDGVLCLLAVSSACLQWWNAVIFKLIVVSKKVATRNSN